MHRPLIRILALVGAVGLCAAALAQTPEQQRQMEYERQQREYWRAQEQQQQEQRRQQERMQEDARRANESWQSWNKTLAPGNNRTLAPGNASGDGGARSNSPSTARSSAGGATAPSGPDCTTPLRAGEPNPLVGAWRFAGTAVPMRGVIAMMVPLEDEAACRRFLPESFEFTADAFVAGGSRRPVTYARQGALVRVCVGHERRYFGVFEPAGPQEIRVAAGPPCRYQRVGTGSHDASAPRPTTTAATAAGLRFNRVYVCQGQRQVVLSCGDSTDDASCAVSYPDELRETRAGVLSMQRSERRGSLVERLKACSAG